MSCEVRILAVSEDDRVRSFIRTSLEAEGHRAFCATSSSEAIDAIDREREWDFLLIDTVRTQPAEKSFSPALLRHFSGEKICVLSEMGDSSWKGHAAKWNVGRVLFKPLLRHDLESLISDPPPSSAAISPLATPTIRPVAPPPPPASSGGCFIEELDNQGFFLAASPAMVQIHKNIRTLASVDHPVLILGESGVGKEVVAKLLHKYHHRRKDHQFVNVNTAALPTELLESELFGFEAGAFTGAVKAKPGKFEIADKGTLLLDEIGEMSPMMQAKLLHVLQDGSFSRLGGRCSTQVDVRILAATNVDLEIAIAERRFREDLYYRLNAFTITVPSLRERREEIPLLIEQMMARGAARAGQEPVMFSSRLMEAAQEYHWPGNLRELRNFVTRMLVLQDQDSALDQLRAKTRSRVNEAVGPGQPDGPRLGMKNVVNDLKHQTEKSMIKEALSASGWNRRRAAINLNISYRALLYKIQQHGLTA